MEMDVRSKIMMGLNQGGTKDDSLPRLLDSSLGQALSAGISSTDHGHKPRPILVCFLAIGGGDDGGLSLDMRR